MANKISTGVNNFSVIPQSKQTPQTVAESAITRNVVLFPIIESDIDKEIFDVELTQESENNNFAVKIESIPEVISESKQIPQLAKTSVSQSGFYRTSGAFNIASASASVRAVNSPTIVNQSYKLSTINPTQNKDFKDIKILDDLPAINLSSEQKVISKSKQIPQIRTITVSEATSVEELKIDYVLGDKPNPFSEKVSSVELTDAKSINIDIDIDSKNNSRSKKIIDDLHKAKSNVVSETDNDYFLIVGKDFDGVGDNETDLFVRRNIQLDTTDSMGDDVFYLGKSDSVNDDKGKDKFFIQTGGNNIISGGGSSDEFSIFNGEIPH